MVQKSGIQLAGIIFSILAGMLFGCSSGDGKSQAASGGRADGTREGGALAAGAAIGTASSTHTLHNVLPVSGKLISGSLPEGDAGFDELKALGVKTIISVDGAAPDLERARARGMRYVHLPIGYHGISPDQQVLLARAVRDLEGPIYLHCHHGKHRGPAAAASAEVLLGRLTPDEGVAFLRKAGTAPSYRGLYACVGSAMRAPDASIDAAPADFPETARIPGFVKAMARAQDVYDHLAEIQEAGWKAPASHPDLVPLAEAGQLENLLRSMIEDPEAARHPEEFGAMLRDSARLAQEFEDGIGAGAPPADLVRRLKAINDSCKGCHVKFRDTKSYSR